MASSCLCRLRGWSTGPASHGRDRAGSRTARVGDLVDEGRSVPCGRRIEPFTDDACEATEETAAVSTLGSGSTSASASASMLVLVLSLRSSTGGLDASSRCCKFRHQCHPCRYINNRYKSRGNATSVLVDLYILPGLVATFLHSPCLDRTLMH